MPVLPGVSLVPSEVWAVTGFLRLTLCHKSLAEICGNVICLPWHHSEFYIKFLLSAFPSFLLHVDCKFPKPPLYSHTR